MIQEISELLKLSLEINMKRFVKILCLLLIVSISAFGQVTQTDEEVIARNGYQNNNRKQKKLIRQEYMHEVGITNFSKRNPDTNSRGLRIGVYSATHFLFGIWAEGAFTQPFSISSNILTPSFGGSYGAGICFDFQRYYFRAQLGLGYRVQHLSAHIQDIIIKDDNVTDAWGYPYHLKYDFHNRVDHGTQHSIQIPLLFGSGIGSFYALGGAKIQVNTSTQATTKAECTTTATYDQFLGVFEEMDNHGLRKNVPINYTNTIEPWTIIDLLASLEAGWEYAGGIRTPGTTKYKPASSKDNAPEWRMRLAVYCDINCLHWVEKSTKVDINDLPNYLVEIPQTTKWDISTFKMNNLLYSNTKIPGYSDFSVGVKLTMCFGFYVNSRCVQCNPSDWLLYKLHGKPPKPRK